jgi:hypothetical protein
MPRVTIRANGKSSEVTTVGKILYPTDLKKVVAKDFGFDLSTLEIILDNKPAPETRYVNNIDSIIGKGPTCIPITVCDSCCCLHCQDGRSQRPYVARSLA